MGGGGKNGVFEDVVVSGWPLSYFNKMLLDSLYFAVPITIVDCGLNQSYAYLLFKIAGCPVKC